MSKYTLITLALLLAVAVGGSVEAQVFPSVALVSFDEATGTYEYTITCPANSTVRMTVQVPEPDCSSGAYHANVRTRDANNDQWPLGD